ncbi:MaoC/PaaZ C-terminal domain-containing protein [Neobacillus sp. FSL H8-0543]|uniref:MaoC/PaaZ C-terminal domain-containing protein n=1 Tax=Neobacillus sp. FSL H8-0543 TaxID=2954672 RepID=UPI003158473E
MNHLNNLQVGESVSFSKTVSESDVYMFAGITGDLGENHVNEEYMKKTPYKKRIAHGALLVGYASTTSTLFIQKRSIPAVSYGYDSIRFIKPVFIGDTIYIIYTIDKICNDTQKSWAKIEIKNQDDELCAVAIHILKYIAKED